MVFGSGRNVKKSPCHKEGELCRQGLKQLLSHLLRIKFAFVLAAALRGPAIEERSREEI